MNIGGALGVVGPKTLNHYQWGQTVVNIVNSHLPNGQYINVFNTGLETTEVILGLPEEKKTALFSIDIGPIHGSISMEEHYQSNQNVFLLAASVMMLLFALMMTYIIYLITGNSLSNDDVGMLKQLVSHLKDLLQAAFTNPDT